MLTITTALRQWKKLEHLDDVEWPPNRCDTLEDPTMSMYVRIPSISASRMVALFLTMPMLVVVACERTQRPSLLEPEQVSHTSDFTGTAPVRPPELPQIALAERIPSFGGFYFEEFEMVIVITDMTQAAIARDEALKWLRAQESVSLGRDGKPSRPLRIRIKRGDYDFMSLRQWRDLINWPILHLTEVVYTSLDYVRNSIVVGMKDVARADKVFKILDDFGVPAEAILVEESDYVPESTTLRSYHRPLRGGIIFPRTDDPPGLGCTLGFQALWNGQDVSLTSVLLLKYLAHARSCRGSPARTLSK
jgi:hypothetical protein